MKNRIYFYSGTGNSLKLAKDIALTLDDCEIKAITATTDTRIPEGLDRIGFIYPVYFLGLPRIVNEFVKQLTFPQQTNTYVFAVTTYGRRPGNSLPQISSLLKSKGIQLNYSGKLKMFSNYVAMYNMSTNVKKITEKSNQCAKPIIADIQSRHSRNPGIAFFGSNWFYQLGIRRVNQLAQHFSVNEDCISCGICEKVCSSQNIRLESGAPTFLENCNQCMACIQYCPHRAINYKQLTQKRRRYTHPQISYKELTSYYTNN